MFTERGFSYLCSGSREGGSCKNNKLSLKRDMFTVSHVNTNIHVSVLCLQLDLQMLSMVFSPSSHFVPSNLLLFEHLCQHQHGADILTVGNDYELNSTESALDTLRL